MQKQPTAYEAFYLKCYEDVNHNLRFTLFKTKDIKREVVVVFGVDRVYQVCLKTGKVELIND